MKALTFWKAVTADRSDFLERLLAVLTENEIAFAVIGGEGVNAYAPPLVSLDLYLAVAARDLGKAEEVVRRQFKVERLPFSINVSAPDSELRVQLQTDPRYGDFVDRAEIRVVLGLSLPVAAPSDLLQGKIWAATDMTRRPTKRAKDLLDIARLIEAIPELKSHVPSEVAEKLPEGLL
jgi:hypothetical protein